MASALGYVAQVINLVAAYMGDTLVYPVVYMGSRSVIKDPISAMMGPRVLVCLRYQIMKRIDDHYSFPLYTRGMEIYRFEYGVFLLNKNLEMVTLIDTATYHP